ncbi:MAG: GNAT family N-acetyltransferase [Chloroflexota bacterium]
MSDQLVLRTARPDDAGICGRICFEAFQDISSRHNFPKDFPSVEAATGAVTSLITHPQVYGVVAELGGQVVGSNFLDERSTIAGVGPITVQPGVQNLGTGRQLMLEVLSRAESKGFAGVRLVQAAYHTRSLALYTKLGFQARELLACLQGSPIGVTIPERAVRSATEADLNRCNELCVRVHGHDRAGDLADAVTAGTATVVEHDGQITGYATSTAFFGHAVGETTADIKAILGAATSFGGPGVLVPARSELFPWCLDQGMRVIQTMTLMSIGIYQDPEGAFCPSIFY